jgi:hypothetical protein
LDSPKELAEQLRAGLEDYPLYNAVLTAVVEEVIDNNEEITKSDILQVFRTSVGLGGSESTLGDGATTFLQTLQYSKLGEYVVGRRGKETRLEISDNFGNIVETIIEESSESNRGSEQDSSDEELGLDQEPMPERVSNLGADSDGRFQINLELSGDESPKKIEELIVGVRRGLTRNIDFQNQEGEEEPVDLDEENKDYQSNSDEEVINSESEDGSEANDEPESESSDQSLETFVGKESATDGE